MDEGSDDNDFFSASDESDLERSRLSLAPGDSSPRPVSPALSSVSNLSFRRNRQKKRQAPQPPTGAGVASAAAGDSTMTTFAHEFHKVVDEESEGSSTLSETPKKVKLSGIASHPIVIPSERAGQVERHGARDKKGFTNLRIRMIDDSLDASSTSPPTRVSYSLPSPVLSDPFARALTPPAVAPFYVASVHPSSDFHEDLGSTSSIAHAFPGGGGNQYVTIAPFGGYPSPMTPHYSYNPNSTMITRSVVALDGGGMVPDSITYLPTSTSTSPSVVTDVSPMEEVSATAQGSSGQWNALAHSASDPGIHHVTKGSLVLAPNLNLEPLSEAEEDSYEDIIVRRRDSSDSDRGERGKVRSSLPKKRVARRHPPPLERSDSVVVAHLYEDLIVSSKWNLKVTFTNLTLVVICLALFMPNSAALLFNFFRLVFGTLFPAYYSYKAVRTKNVKEYVKWMMYWIVFAFFTCAETITDVFFSFWFPFYYEIKILVVLWLLSPATRGSSILYRKFVHPWLTKKEEEIDDCIAKAKQQGYSTVVQLGTKGVNYATSVIMQTAIKGGGGLVSQLKRSYSTSEIGEDTADHNRNLKSISHKELPQSPSEDDDVSMSSGSYESEPRHRAESESLSSRPRGHSTGRSVRTGKARSADVSEVYFHEVQEPVTQRRSPRTHDAGRTGDSGGHSVTTRRSRSGDVSYATLPRTTSKRASVKKRQA